jgi:probable H4MPT-linked C1 transfer pathway protein
MSPILGLDVGGANLKAAHSAGSARTIPFALWRDPGGLPAALARLVEALPPAEGLAVTMTGELCDCFASKREGVGAILDAVEGVAGGRAVRVFDVQGRFVDLAGARAEPLRVAASNWLALATFAGRFACEGAAILIDVGSTTTDIIPLYDGVPCPVGRTDRERMLSRELVYLGVRRTPLCAAMPAGRVAAELFATMLDVYLVLGNLPEDATDRNTADGRLATRAAAHARLARMLCADLETSAEVDRDDLARIAALGQRTRLIEVLEEIQLRLPEAPRTFVLAGEGEFLAHQVLDAFDCFGIWKRVSLADRLDAEVSRAACAYAVAVLAAEGEGC